MIRWSLQIRSDEVGIIGGFQYLAHFLTITHHERLIRNPVEPERFLFVRFHPHRHHHIITRDLFPLPILFRDHSASMNFLAGGVL